MIFILFVDHVQEIPEVSVQKRRLNKGDLNVNETETTVAADVHASEDKNRDAVTTPDHVNIETDGQHLKKRRTTKTGRVKGSVDFYCKSNYYVKHTFMICCILMFINN